jgi:hypothetical protein
MTRLVRRADGAWVEVMPASCPRCETPWLFGQRARFQAGSVILGGHAHRTWLCLDCGHEVSDPPLPKSSAPRLMAPDGGLVED